MTDKISKRDQYILRQIGRGVFYEDIAKKVNLTKGRIGQIAEKYGVNTRQKVEPEGFLTE